MQRMTSALMLTHQRLVPASEELTAGRRADRLNVVIFQFHSLCCQFVQCWGLDGWVVVADVVEALLESHVTWSVTSQQP